MSGSKLSIVMAENMPKLSTLPVPNHFQYAPSFIGTYQQHTASAYIIDQKYTFPKNILACYHAIYIECHRNK